MKVKSIATLMAAAAALLSACGGGGSDSATAGSAGGGGVPPASATAVSYGTITQFGSIWVNGVEFSTGNASFRIKGKPGLASDLRIGMVVRVDGSINDKVASLVSVDEAMSGRVEQVLDANRMVVMGQSVQIDARTRFENGAVPVAGDFVEVHGQVVADGTLAAGFIEKKAALPTPPFAVKGFVKSHNPAARTFVVGTLTVSYAGATVNDLPAGSWDGQLVEVKGSACAGNPVCGTLTATQVEPGGLRVAEMAQVEVEGFVASVSGSGFVIGRQSVQTTPSTVFAGGALADIAVGTQLEVEGAISAGVLTAAKVTFRDSVRIEADVASVNLASGSITLAGLPGVTVSVNSLTEFKGVAALAGLAASNHLRIRGRAGSGAAGTLVATRLERRSTASSPGVILQAPVTAVSGTTSVTLLGVVVNTATLADAGFRNVSDAPIGRAAFFAALKLGAVVNARGSLSGSGVAWNEIQFED